MTEIRSFTVYCLYFLNLHLSNIADYYTDIGMLTLFFNYLRSIDIPVDGLVIMVLYHLLTILYST